MLRGVFVLVLSFLSVQTAVAVSPDETLKNAQTLFASGRPDEAVSMLESLADSQPKSTVALRGLAAAYASVGDDRAEQTYRRAIASSPRDFALRLEWVEFLWSSERSESGNQEMVKLLSEAGSPPLHAHYAFELMRQERFVDASREFERACGSCDAETLEAWGGALLETGRFAESAARYREAITRQPDRISARHRLGRVLLLAGDPASARVELERAIQRAPDSAEISFDLGRSLEALGRVEDAEAAYRKAIALAPELGRAHYALGTLLARRGRGEEARPEIALYQRSFDREQKERLEIRARRAELSLGWSELAQGESDKAILQFARRPDDPEALLGKARALGRLGRHSEAVSALEHALTILPRDPRILYALGRERVKAKAS